MKRNPPIPPKSEERLQKILARTGIASRRAIETMIREGRITVNGRQATLGDKVTERDKICIDKKRVNLAAASKCQEQPRVLLYHKPVGLLCTRDDPEGRPTIFSVLPRLRQGRWISVGRLDLKLERHIHAQD